MKETIQLFRDAPAHWHEPEFVRRFADAYWRVVCMVAVCITLISIAFGAWLFLMPPQIIMSETAVGASVSGFNRDELRAVADTIEKRTNDFEAGLLAP